MKLRSIIPLLVLFLVLVGALHAQNADVYDAARQKGHRVIRAMNLFESEVLVHIRSLDEMAETTSTPTMGCTSDPLVWTDGFFGASGWAVNPEVKFSLEEKRAFLILERPAGVANLVRALDIPLFLVLSPEWPDPDRRNRAVTKLRNRLITVLDEIRSARQDLWKLYGVEPERAVETLLDAPYDVDHAGEPDFSGMELE